MSSQLHVKATDHLVDVAGVAAFIIWTFQHSEWNASKTNKRKLFLKDLGEQLVAAKISTRIQKSRTRKASRAAIEQMGYSFQQAEEDLPLAADALAPPPRKRCHLCPHSKHRKNQQLCHKCQRKVCGEHSVTTKICLHCA